MTVKRNLPIVKIVRVADPGKAESERSPVEHWFELQMQIPTPFEGDGWANWSGLATLLAEASQTFAASFDLSLARIAGPAPN
jgi:hypothetical protein